MKLIVLACGVIASTSLMAKDKYTVADPYESFNRKMYDFNESVDHYVASPIANGYKVVTPDFLQTGVFNFFNNLKNFNVVINDVLQAKFSQSASDMGRLTMNTTAGLGGFFDVAKHVGLEQNDEDFDQTFAVWGIPKGSYLVLPLLGPMTTRSAPASAFDAATNPASYASIPANYISAPVQFMSALNARANAEGALKFINEAAMDKYVFTRESFLQWRKNLESDGKVNMDDDLMADNVDDTSLTQNWRDYGKQFESTAQSFSGVARQFDQTVLTYEQANHKIAQVHQLRTK
ncbi:MAG: VacJ family lipoprotein [Methylococcales bacterium]|jgi:phospholipid-binding lipoprotein MlaA|nr:VacJ family lipoprotein [Methylococcales bacterium]